MADSDKIEWILLDTDLTTRKAILPASQSHLYFEINEPGSGELKIPLDSNSAALVSVGMFAQCNYRGAARGGFFIDNVSRYEASAEEGGGRWMSISGRGPLALLEDAMVWDSGSGESTRDFTAQAAGAILKTLIDEAKARGGLANLTYDFTATQDSVTTAWTDSDNYSLSVGTSLLDVVRQFTRAWSIDFKITLTGGNFLLSAYKAGIGTNKSTTIKFRTGTNSEEIYSDERGDAIKNAYLVTYKDGFITQTDSTSISDHRRREGYLQTPEAQTTTLAAIYGSAELDQNKDPKKSISVRVYDGVKPYVFLDYDMGDYVMLDILGTETSYRVLGLQMDFEGDKFSDIVVELNSLLYENEIRQQRQLDRLTNILTTAKKDAATIYINQWFTVNTDFATYRIYDFLIDNGILYVCGSFDTIGGVTATNIAQYNLDTRIWSPLGDDGALSDDVALCMAVSGNTLFIGGRFHDAAGIAAADHVVKYDIPSGVYSALTIVDTIAPLTVGISSDVEDMVVSGDHLFMTGNWVYPKDSPLIIDYSISGDTHQVTSASNLADYGKGKCVVVNDAGTIAYIGGDYNILPAGSTIATYTVASKVIASFYDPFPSFPIKDIYCMTIHDGILYAAGHNTWDSGASFQTVARFTLPSGTPTIFGSALTYVNKMGFDAYHHLILVGNFTSGSGITGADDIISYSIDSGDWITVGQASSWNGASIYAMIYDGEDLYVGGDDNLTLGGIDCTMGVYITSLPNAMQFLQNSGHNHPPVTIGTPANGLSIDANQVLTIGLASTSTIGALSDTDWDTFNNKLGTSAIDDTAYDATTWNGDTTHAPSKNAVRDKIESMGAGGHVIQDEGTPLTARANLNFIGAGVTATDNAGNNATDVTITSGAAVADIGSTAETVGGSVANGTAVTASRSDHKHAITTIYDSTAPANLAGTATAGTALMASRTDHVHLGLTSTQLTDLTDAGDSTLHYHVSDRDSANFTGTNWTDLTDGGATTLHSHAAAASTQNYLITEDLTSQVTGGTATFTLLVAALAKCHVYANLRQQPADITMASNMLSFTLSYTPTTADKLIVDYYPANPDAVFIYDDGGNIVIDDNADFVLEA